MKLRIRGNSVRLRLSQSDMTQIVDHGLVVDSVEFAPSEKLEYRLETVPSGEVRAAYQGNSISVLLPKSTLEKWAHTSEVSIEGLTLLTNGSYLKILVEKDFTCLTSRDNEDEADLFPNPNKTN
jgi:hypothetical protein